VADSDKERTDVTDSDPNSGQQARQVLRGVRGATLATNAGGQPFVSLVTAAFAPDLSALLLLSSMSAHTRHLMADPRCSLLVCGPAPDINPQTAARVTVTGLAEQVTEHKDDKAARARFLAVHPYATLYAGFADFSIWRIRPGAALFVAGFARAHRLDAGALLPDAEAVAAIAAAEAGILSHCNSDHADAMALIAEAAGERAGAWRLVTVDPDGCDLALDERVVRVHWAAPAKDARDVQQELVRLTKKARAGRR